MNEVANNMPKQHLGAHIGPAPTNKQLGITTMERAVQQEFCSDPKHSTPCPLPCRACKEER